MNLYAWLCMYVTHYILSIFIMRLYVGCKNVYVDIEENIYLSEVK